MNRSARRVLWTAVVGLLCAELALVVFVPIACSFGVLNSHGHLCRSFFTWPNGQIIGPAPSPLPSHSLPQQLRANQVNVLLNLEQAAETVLTKLSNNSTVKQADFRRRFGADADEVMQGLEVVEVTKRGTQIDIERRRDTVDTLGNNTVFMSQHLSFDAIQTVKGIEASHIVGIRVNIGSGLPDLQVRKVLMHKDTQGNTIMDLELELASYLPNISHTVIIDPNGQLVN